MVGMLSTKPEGQGPEDYGWFAGDLADDIPTPRVPVVRRSPPPGWAAPMPEPLARLLDVLKNDL